MLTIKDIIDRVNSDDPMTDHEMRQAKLMLDGYATGGKTDVLQARMRLHRRMREQGLLLDVPEPEKPKPTTAQNIGNIAVVLGALGLFVAIIFGIGSSIGGDDDDDSSSGADEIGASVICEQFVEDRLRSPGTADFAGYGSQIVTGGPSRFVVRSYVDSENGFGALLRTSYTCTVTSTDGENWTLVDLSTSED